VQIQMMLNIGLELFSGIALMTWNGGRIIRAEQRASSPGDQVFEDDDRDHRQLWTASRFRLTIAGRRKWFETVHHHSLATPAGALIAESYAWGTTFVVELLVGAKGRNLLIQPAAAETAVAMRRG
jgi:hypothetical protein